MKDAKTLFCVGKLETSIGIAFGPSEISKELKWAEGMIGVIPVFETFDYAKKYLEKEKYKDYSVYMLETQPPTNLRKEKAHDKPKKDRNKQEVLVRRNATKNPGNGPTNMGRNSRRPAEQRGQRHAKKSRN